MENCTAVHDTPMSSTTVDNGKVNGRFYHCSKHVELPNGNLHHTTPIYNPNNAESGEAEELVFVLSAKDETAIEARRLQLKNYITGHPQANTDTFLHNLAYTLGSRRSLFKRSLAYLASSATKLVSALERQNVSIIPPSDCPRVGFVFTGQGAQWAGMGSQLIHSYPVFRDALFRADACMRSLGSEWSLIGNSHSSIANLTVTNAFLDELLRDAKTSRINEMVFSLPICAAVQLALVELLRTWGVTPTAVTGHSSGEIAAAYVVGGLSFESVIAIAYLRGAISSNFDLFAQGKGGMLAVGLGRESAESYIQRQTAGMAVVACVNSQMSVTVSGDIEALAALEIMLKADNVFARRLKVSAAFHSPHMAPVADAYTRVLEKVLALGAPANIMFSSSLTGDCLENIDMLSRADYWVQNMLQAVEFQSSFSNLCLDENSEQRVDVVVEIGPHGALAGPIQQILTLPQLSKVKIAYMNCLTRGQNATTTMRQLACNLIQHGLAVNLTAVNTSRVGPPFEVLHDLPPYPWTHQTRYWTEPRVSYDLRFRPHRHHDLLGARLPGSNKLIPTWRHIIRISEMPWVREHCVQSQIIYPGAGLICMAIEGFRQLCHENNENVEVYELRDVDISKALAVDEDGSMEVQMTILPTSKSLLGNEGWHEFRIYSYTHDRLQWIEHCRGLIHGQRTLSSITPESTSCRIERLGAERNCQRINPDNLFEFLRGQHIEHGPVFRNIKTIEPLKTGVTEVSFEVADIAVAMPSGYQHEHIIHPTTLDSIFLAAYSGALFGSAQPLDNAYVPRSIKQLTISGNICADVGHVFQATSTVHQLDSQTLGASVVVHDGDIPVLEINTLDCQSLGGKAVRKSTHVENGRMRGFISWREDIALNNAKALVNRLRFAVDPTEANQLRDLKHACLHYMQQALNSSELPDKSSMEPHLRKYVSWMQHQLKSHPVPGETMNNLQIENLLASVATATVNGELVTRLGKQLIPILRQEITALELMRQGDLLTNFYRHALKINRSYWQAAEIIRLCTHKNPRAQVLEIGAGTGSGTQAFFNAIDDDIVGSSLAPFEHYTFTDISAGFFEAAKSLFHRWEHMMSFRKLDIEIDPEKQGFEPNSYDIIIAAQCLHATANMSTTLSHVRKLLRPGGKLILVETTQDHVDLSFSFGLLSGWWLGMSISS
jgi:acyl transferase domain-containing protein/predicted O-methyltransferase YrrM